MRLRIIAIALAAGLALVGCGSSSKKSSGTTGGTSASAGGSDSSSSFCKQAKDLESKYGQNFDPSTSPNKQQALTDLKSLANNAPSAIKADLQTVADAFEKAINNDTAALQGKEAQIQTASDNVVKYLSDHCGITESTTPTT